MCECSGAPRPPILTPRPQTQTESKLAKGTGCVTVRSLQPPHVAVYLSNVSVLVESLVKN